MGLGGIFPTNPDLADILGRTDLNSEIFCFWDPKFLDFQVPRSPNSQISRFPDFQVPRFPDAAGAAGPGRTLPSQPDPSPNAPRDQIRRKGPLLRLSHLSLPKNTSKGGKQQGLSKGSPRKINQQISDVAFVQVTTLVFLSIRTLPAF